MIVRVLGIIACLLLIISFCRLAIGVPPLSVYDLILYVSSYDVGFDEIAALVEALSTNAYLSMLHTWNGEIGFFENIALWLVSAGNLVYTFVVDVVFAFFTSVVDIYRFAWNVIYLIAGLLGFVSL